MDRIRPSIEYCANPRGNVSQGTAFTVWIVLQAWYWIRYSLFLCSSTPVCEGRIAYWMHDVSLLQQKKVSFDHSQDHIPSSALYVALVNHIPMRCIRSCALKARTFCGSVELLCGKWT